ncbi:CPBP family intramembrane glutamic endopeptidase [Corynebacterium uberis]|uniref:CPBP family intramembrane glutamic endopeptidase n=1 Tax=Corynebacterium TaxID=1716 RepID=UPI001D09F42D|nr:MULTISPECIES: CPBP family intramembrane glutamic endopeptidase [Corynebacterium]MCZ9309576.1 CPBP family intramembrane metalloprotease [Corynebacterium sp. c6VSa_13]UDL73387.1 CPBP family intramembrane metalloprotease [Corynebacterium uberis]UDL75734.1 CPBP family intramembrane metalloprotease [Corynebacterium uberis]UDL77946.1 CPBP family intramembrane metalloprotease [Corynebacterium uberis]UDL80230.1 CPBP family intramembrane metalloprotease [Corynebacterium uberis]
MATLAHRRRLVCEVALVLALTFGASGLRSLLRLIAAVASPTPLAQQQVTLNATQATNPWIDAGLQLVGAGVLIAWGGLAVYLLAIDGIALRRPRWRDAGVGALLAAVIGVPGLALYLLAWHAGLSREVVASGLDSGARAIPLLLVWAGANAAAEELVVVAWLSTRLGQLGCPGWAVIVCSALLRGSYHLYQGFSAGVGNAAMGLLCAAYYRRTGRVAPLIWAHFLLDTCAFVGYHLLAGHTSWLPG